MKWVVCLLSKRWWNFSIYWKLAEKKREWNEICEGKKRAMPSHWVLICRNHITIYQLKANYLEDSLGFSDLIDFLNHIKLFFSINFFNKMTKRNVYSLFMLCVYIFVIFKNWILSLINLFIIEHCFLKPISMWKKRILLIVKHEIYWCANKPSTTSHLPQRQTYNRMILFRFLVFLLSFQHLQTIFDVRRRIQADTSVRSTAANASKNMDLC